MAFGEGRDHVAIGSDVPPGRVEFVKLNIDENPVVASRYDVLAIPTAILFEGGEARETVVGARSRSHYEDAWADWLSPR